MAALLVAIGLLLGTSAPASLAAITTLQWVELSLTLAGKVPKVIKTAKEIEIIINSPQFRAWAAANGEAAIRLRPGLSTER